MDYIHKFHNLLYSSYIKIYISTQICLGKLQPCIEHNVITVFLQNLLLPLPSLTFWLGLMLSL